MCMLIDSNIWGEFFKKTKDSQPIHNWINKGGKLVYSDHNQIKKEMGRVKKILKFIQSRKQAGLDPLKIISKDQVEEEIKIIKKTYPLKSDDPHILALARAGGATLLYSKDEKLNTDFKKIIKGKIYKNKKNKNLLTQNTCP